MYSVRFLLEVNPKNAQLFTVAVDYHLISSIRHFAPCSMNECDLKPWLFVIVITILLFLLYNINIVLLRDLAIIIDITFMDFNYNA